MPRNPDCELCVLHQSARNVCIWGHGDGDGFVIGEAPGREERRTGRVFQGKAGQLARPILAECGLPDPYITNAAKCHPPGNRKPEPGELKACKPYLLEEIEEKKPKAILLWGAVAMKTAIGKTGITEMNGQIVEKDGQTYVCCFHPAYVLRDPSKTKDFRMAVGRYAAVLKGTFSNKLPPWRPIDKSSFDEFIASWARCEQYSFDVEATGLDWYADQFRVHSIAFTLSDVAQTWEETWGTTLDTFPVMPYEMRVKFLAELARSSANKVCVGQNAKYDNLALGNRYGVTFPLTDDTLLAHHLVDENAVHALKPVARQYCGAPDYDIPLEEKTNPKSARRILAYNCPDATYTNRLLPIFKNRLDADERWLYERVIMPAARTFQRAESGGLYVDLKKMDQVAREEQVKMVEAESKLNRIARRKVNWNSPSQVAEVLYKDLGLTPTVFTDKVNPETNEQDTPSTSEAALVDLDHPITKLLQDYREYKKNQSTYTGTPQSDGSITGGLRDFMVGPHLYISTKLTGTVTGRYSSRLHSIPRDSNIRSCITAPPGWLHGQLDLSQAELKTIAITARDPEMLRCFKAGQDIHWRTLMEVIRAGQGDYLPTVFETVRKITRRKVDFHEAIDILSKLPPDNAIALVEAWKEGRKKAKGVNFGFPYGQSADGFIDYAKLKFGFESTRPEATQFRNVFFNLYGALPAWHERQKKLVRIDGFVRSMSGRKRHLPGIFSDDRSLVGEAERQAINAPIQGFIGDYKAMIAVELDESFSQDHFRVKMEHHDAIQFWVKEDHVNQVLPRVKEIGDNPRLARECGLDFPIAFTVDIDLGPWGAGKRWKGHQ